MDNLMKVQAECYQLMKANQEMHSFIQQLMQKAGVTNANELVALVQPLQTEVQE